MTDADFEERVFQRFVQGLDRIAPEAIEDIYALTAFRQYFWYSDDNGKEVNFQSVWYLGHYNLSVQQGKTIGNGRSGFSVEAMTAY